MPDTPKVAGFLSYAHEDDKHDNGRISRLRERLELSIRVSAGVRGFTIFQDKAGIGWGKDWDRVITQSIDSGVVLFPIVSPLWFASPNCRDELRKFEQRQARLGQDDLILPVYYRPTGLMEDDDDSADAEERELGTLLRRLQFEDWRALRRTEETDPAYPAAIERLAERAVPVLRRFRHTCGGAGPVVVKPAGTLVQATDDRSRPGPSKASGFGRDEPDGSSLPGAIQTCVVDHWGRGDFTTISDALKGAPVGSRILVRPGHYVESLVMDRPIELIGDGERDDIVVDATTTETLMFDTNIGYVRNITLRQRGDGNYCVWIKQGRLTIEECDISSRSFSCLAVRNAADPRVRRNRIHGGSRAGILVYGDARGTYEENDIFANARSGIEISDNADPIVRRNRIHDGGLFGVNIDETGRGTYEDNDIFANAGAGIAISDNADPIVRRNRIHDGQASGVQVGDDGRGTYEDNAISDNAGAGIRVFERAVATVRRNKISGSGWEAIWVADGSGGTFEDNDLRDNERGPWDVEQASKAKVKRARNIEK